MKIGIIIIGLEISGGGQRQALKLAECLQRKGHNVTIYTRLFNKSKCYPDIANKVNIKYLYNEASNVNSIRHTNIFPLLKDIWRMSKIIDSSTDLLNPHEAFSYWVSFLYKFKHKVPIVWSCNDIPHIPQVRRSFWKEPIEILRSIRRKFIIFVDRIIEKKSISEIVVLDNRNRILVKKYLHSDSVVIRSGLDVKKFKFIKRRFDSKKNNFKILATGIFFPHRRFEDLIRALDTLKKDGHLAQLNFIGSDAYDRMYAKKIRDLVSKLALEKQVNFLGSVSEEELVRNYSTSDVFVFPNYPQTWGLAVFEAMACGTPVVLSTGCGASEVLTNGENALLFFPGRVEEIAACLKQLFNDEQLWERLSVNGRRFVEENIRWDLYGKRMLQLFSEVISNYSRS